VTIGEAIYLIKIRNKVNLERIETLEAPSGEEEADTTQRRPLLERNVRI